MIKSARLLVAGVENFGYYSIDFDEEKRTFTVYFILKEDAVESKAMRNAQSCRYETKMAFSGDERISVTYLENNQKSFSFNIVVDEDDKVASVEDDVQFRFATDEDVESEEGDNSDMNQQKGHGSEKQKEIIYISFRKLKEAVHIGRITNKQMRYDHYERQSYHFAF